MNISKEKIDYILKNISECQELYEIIDSDILEKSDWCQVPFETDLDKDLSTSSSPRDMRIKIFRYGICNMKGLKWTESKLKEYELRKPYCRNYNELIIYFCLKATDNGYSVGLNEYKLIQKKCDEYRKNNGISYSNEEIDTTTTLRSLKRFLNERTEKITNEETYTRTITSYIGTSIDKLFSGTLDDVIDKLCKLISANDIDYVKLNDKARYYVIKYLVILIEYNIGEFIHILNNIVGLSNSQLIKYIKELLNGTTVYDNNLWGIKNELTKHSNEWSTLIDEIENGYEKTARRTQLLKYSFLNSIINYLYIFGKPIDTINISPLFIDINNPDQIISLGNFSKIGNLFSNPDENGFDKTQKIIEQISNLTISNFEDYRINFGRIAIHLFSVVEDTKVNSIKYFLTKVIYGTNDVSRSTLLYILMLIKQITENNIAQKNALTVARVNHILDKSGFEQLDSTENIFDALVEISLGMSNSDFMCFYCDLINQYKDDKILKTGDSDTLIPIIFECKNSMLPLTLKL